MRDIRVGFSNDITVVTEITEGQVCPTLLTLPPNPPPTPPDPRPDPTLTLACGLVALLTLVQFLALLRIHKVKEALLPGVPDPHSSFLGLSEKHHGNFQVPGLGIRGLKVDGCLPGSGESSPTSTHSQWFWPRPLPV
nr:cytokine receptor-like factor 2 [Rattus norvegicus]